MKNNNIPFISLFIGSILIILGTLFSACGRIDSINNMDLKGIFKSDMDSKINNFAPYEPKLDQPPLIQFIVDEKDSLNVAYSNHVEKIADYTKLPFQKIELADWNANPIINKSTRVLCFLETKNIKTSTIDTILEFVAKGGTLFFAQAITDDRFGYLAGIKITGDLDTDINSKGIHFTSPFLPNLNGKSIKTTFAHFGLTQNNFSPSVNVLATASDNPKLPIIIENKIGKGKIIYFNSTIYLDKEDRGLLFSFILSGLEGIPYPIANTSTIFLDDFPAPLFDIKIQPIASEMNLNSADFEIKAWWPDLKILAHKYNISYTAMPCFDYEDNTNPPFDFSQWDSKKIRLNNKIESASSWLMKDCLRNGNELGFHGYNHVSLDTKEWENNDYIPIAFNAVQKKWGINDFGNLPVTYVPPSNVIDKMGVEKLRIGMPSLQFMCSLYSGEKVEGCDREFDFEPYDATLFNYPRITAGFYMNEDKKFSQQSMYLYTGIWTHFIHPDDVYQIKSIYNKSKGGFDLRNYKNLGWRTTKGKKGGMFYEFDNYLKEITQLFPQIRFLNANKAGHIVYNWRASSFKHTEIANNYTVERVNQKNSNSQYWFLYASQLNVASVDQQLKNQQATFSKTVFQKGFLYTILTPKGKLSIQDIAKREVFSKKELITEMSKLKKNYSAYLVAFKKNYDYINGYSLGDYKVKGEQEMTALKNKVLSDAVIDYPTWNKFATYMSWTNKADEVWKMLKDKCDKFPSPKNIMYAKELDKVIGYPDEATQEYWLNKQLLLFPKNTDLLNSYINAFNTEKNYKNITKAYQNLIKTDKSNATYLSYIEHILAYEPDLALSELKNVAPNENLRPLAETITWLFADHNYFQKAYDWSELTDKISFQSKLYWLEELKDYDTLETQYLIYAAQNPNDYKVRAEMSTIYYDIDRFKDSWILANSLPTCPEKDSLQKMLNVDVLEVDPSIQKDLLEHYSGLFFPEVKRKIIKENRLQNGN